MKNFFYLFLIVLICGVDVFAQCDKVFHTNLNPPQTAQQLGTKPTFINADCKIAFESSDKGIFAYIKITNSPPSKIGDQLMFLQANGTQYFYDYKNDSKELSYNNHNTKLELDVKALEWLANNTLTKVGVVNRIENKMYSYSLDATRQYEFKKVLNCLVNALDRSKTSKKTITPSSKSKLNNKLPAATKPQANSNSGFHSRSNLGANSNPLAKLNMMTNSDSLLKEMEKMLYHELGGQISKINPNLGNLFNGLVGPNSGFNLGSLLNSGNGLQQSPNSSHNMGSFLNSNSGTATNPNLPPNPNPSQFNSKEDLEKQIERCELSIQSLQKKIAVNSSANNTSANPPLIHQVNKYEEEIQNYLNQIKDME